RGTMGETGWGTITFVGTPAFRSKRQRVDAQHLDTASAGVLRLPPRQTSLWMDTRLWEISPAGGGHRRGPLRHDRGSRIPDDHLLLPLQSDPPRTIPGGGPRRRPPLPRPCGLGELARRMPPAP